MKRIALLFMACLIALVFNMMVTRTASARPEYKTQMDEITKNTKFADLMKEQKCNVCHYGKTKKNRNDFGQALNKTMSDEVYKKLKAEEDKEKLTKKINEALKAAMKEKSKSGKTFGELIEAGELPAKNPE
jgi:hypothetical protein